jgi:hypothetical protein
MLCKIDFLMAATFFCSRYSTMSLGGLRQRNRAMSEVDVFTTSEKQLRDLAASFSRLRLELQFGARLHSGIAIPTYVRIAPIASEVRHRSEMSRRANCD